MSRDTIGDAIQRSLRAEDEMLHKGYRLTPEQAARQVDEEHRRFGVLLLVFVAVAHVVIGAAVAHWLSAGVTP